MSEHVVFNIGECFLWLLISIILLAKSTRATSNVRSIFRVLSLAFFLFGVSDLIEAHTGAWWTPIWLLFLKGGCIVAFVWGFFRYYRIVKGSRV